MMIITAVLVCRLEGDRSLFKLHESSSLLLLQLQLVRLQQLIKLPVVDHLLHLNIFRADNKYFYPKNNEITYLLYVEVVDSVVEVADPEDLAALPDEVLDPLVPGGRVVRVGALVLAEGHPVADVVIILIPPLELLLVRRQVAAHEADLRGVKPAHQRMNELHLVL